MLTKQTMRPGSKTMYFIRIRYTAVNVLRYFNHNVFRPNILLAKASGFKNKNNSYIGRKSIYANIMRTNDHNNMT